ncbi:MAG: dihydroneopterin aldolase [Chthonomonas sp.]|nr:dihydroneopterin aldolase [Chthonomonas sp.]
MQTTIAIHDLEVYAYHGVPAAEREVGHRLLVDVELVVEELAGETDSIDGTVDYAEVANMVRDVILESSVQTLEFLCSKVTHALVATFPAIVGGTISIAKPYPPMPCIVAEVRVTREFSAED